MLMHVTKAEEVQYLDLKKLKMPVAHKKAHISAYEEYIERTTI